MIPAILAPIPDVFTPIAEILATVPHILPTIADTAVVQRITAILAPIADVLAAIPHVLPVITHVFAAVPPILTAVRPRGGIWPLSGLGQGVERGHQRQPQHENSNYCTHLQLPVRPPALRGRRRLQHRHGAGISSVKEPIQPGVSLCWGVGRGTESCV